MLSAVPRRMRRSDDGVTLVELLVVMVLASVVGMMTLLVFNGADKASSATGDRLNGSAAARTTLQSWQALLQVAAPAPPTNLPSGTIGPSTQFCVLGGGHVFEWINATDMLFYANVGNLQDGAGRCSPSQLIWLAERDGALLEAHYDFSAPSTWNLDTCRTLTLGPHASVDEAASPVVFTAYLPGGSSLSGMSATLLGANPFDGVTACSGIPGSIEAGQVSDLDDATTNLLNQVNAVGIDFTVTDQTGTHSQSFEARAALYGGSS